VPVLGLLLALATPSALAAQSVTLRLGGFRTYYADSLDATAGSVAADAAWSSAKDRLGLAGSFSSFANDGWAAQGAANWTHAVSFSGARGLLAIADMNSYGFNSGEWAGVGGVGLAGVAFLGPATGTVTGSAGGVHRLGGTDDLLGQVTARLRRDAGVVTLDTWASASWAGIERYQDLGAGLHAEWSSFAVDLNGGGRFGDLGDVAWAQGRAAIRISGRGWLEASAGRYPPDVTGYQQGSFVQAGLRVNLGRPPGRPVRRPEATAIEIERESGGTVVLTFRVEGREPVEIAGDWNGWTPQPVTPAGAGRWRARLVLEPGLHRFTLLDSRGDAFVPDGIPSEPDDFGSSTGLFSVPQR